MSTRPTIISDHGVIPFSRYKIPTPLPATGPAISPKTTASAIVARKFLVHVRETMLTSSIESVMIYHGTFWQRHYLANDSRGLPLPASVVMGKPFHLLPGHRVA
jgi:hypothetical protein